jgi:glycosyltransferase involved in cell wall biosynthesis
MLTLLPSDNIATRAFCLRAIPYMARHGVSADVFPPSSPRIYRLLQSERRALHVILSTTYWYVVVLPRRVVHLVVALKYDVIFVQRGLLHYAAPPALEWMLKQLTTWVIPRPVVYHLDDALYAVSNPRHYARRCQYADAVMTGNKELEAFAQRYNTRILWLGYGVDVKEYPVKEHDATLPITIGFVGMSARRLLPPIMESLAAACKDGKAVVKVVGQEPFEPPELRGLVSWEKWTPEREREVLLDLDIGIVPLPDTAYNRGKETYKIKEYMAAGLPIVASDVGHSRYLIEHGTTGFLAESNAAWIEHLEKLRDDPSLRKQIGENARRFVSTSYDLPENSRHFAWLLQSLLSKE